MPIMYLVFGTYTTLLQPADLTTSSCCCLYIVCSNHGLDIGGEILKVEVFPALPLIVGLISIFILEITCIFLFCILPSTLVILEAFVLNSPGLGLTPYISFISIFTFYSSTFRFLPFTFCFIVVLLMNSLIVILCITTSG